MLGCGGMADLAPHVGQEVGLPVVEGVTAAVQIAESLVRLGLRTSKHGDLAPPPPKAFAGRFSHFSSTNGGARPLVAAQQTRQGPLR